MFRFLILLVLALFVQLREATAAEMTATDNALEGIFAGLVFIDYRQTLDIKNHPDMVELNPLLGRHPSDDRVAIACGTTVLLHYVIARLIEPEKRHWFQGITIGLEGANVARNFSVGVHARF